MSGQRYTSVLERPKTKRTPAAEKAVRVPTEAEKKWDRLMSHTLAHLNEGNYDEFWRGIELLNAHNVLLAHNS